LAKGADEPVHSRRGSPWITLIIFCLVSFFNPEILTGSTSAEKLINPFTWLGMVFYGFQVAIIASITAKRGFSWKTVYILGLIYGILEEGFAVMTMEAPKPPGFVDLFRVAGLNVTWTIYISTFHAVVSVLSSIMIIRLVWPNRVSSGFLGKRQFAVMLPSLAIVYSLFIFLVTSEYVPEISALVILAVVCMVLGLTARRRFSLPPPVKNLLLSRRRVALLAFVLALAAGIVPFILGTIEALWAPLTVYLMVVAFLYSVFFDRIDRDGDLTGEKQLIMFAIFVGSWLVLGTFFRTPFSNLVAYVGVAVQLYLGWRSIKRPIPSV
jgi:hypothetical protein